MTGEILSKPGGVDTVKLQFCEQFCVVDDVEAFAKVDKAQDRDFAVIHSTQCTVRNVKQSRLGGVSALSGSKTMLGWREG